MRKRKQKEVVEVKQSKGAISTISELIVKICVFFLKFMAICILFCISFYLIGMAIVFSILYLFTYSWCDVFWILFGDDFSFFTRVNLLLDFV